MMHTYQKQANADQTQETKERSEVLKLLTLGSWHMRLLPFGLQIFLSNLSSDSGLQEAQGL